MLRTHSQAASDLVHVHTDVTAIDISSTRCGREQACQYGHGGSLACPIVTKERGYLSFVEI